MLTLTLKPGEYVDIGDNIRFVFTGGTINNIHVLVDAPKDKKVFRSEAPPKPGKSGETPKKGQKPDQRGNEEEDLESRIRRLYKGY